MNRSERFGIITGLVAISLLARYNSAIAETLKSNDKKTNQTEQTTNIQQQVSDDLSLNLMSP
ncbi:hypothetical protein K9M48_03470, partial [Candidatus Gracilibacteria bacterium]|nr:hypothetical protein [Candidatus Gracilibacteria bacterium]